LGTTPRNPGCPSCTFLGEPEKETLKIKELLKGKRKKFLSERGQKIKRRIKGGIPRETIGDSKEGVGKKEGCNSVRNKYLQKPCARKSIERHWGGFTRNGVKRKLNEWSIVSLSPKPGYQPERAKNEGLKKKNHGVWGEKEHALGQGGGEGGGSQKSDLYKLPTAAGKNERKQKL